MRIRLVAFLEIVGAIAALFLAAILIGLIAPLLPESARTPVQALAMWGAVLAGALMLRRTGRSYRDLGLRRPDSWLKTLGWTAGAMALSFAGAALLGTLIQVTTDWPPLDTAYLRDAIEGDALAYLLFIVLVVWGSAAFGEELFARGFVLDRMQILFGGWRGAQVAAIVGQAALFGIFHAQQGPTGIVITFYVGLVLAGIWLASGRNLWAPILAHGLMDTISLTLMFAGQPLQGYID